MAKIGIVSVVTNEKNNLTDFYNSLITQTFQDFILYFVDNNSLDGSVQFFQELNEKELIKTEYIHLEYNSGFSAGSNIGASEAIKDKCRYLFILNNDVILDDKCLEELINLLELNKNISCTGPLLYRHKLKFPEIIQEFGGKINFNKATLTKYYENKNIKEVKLPETLETDFVGGGVCFIKSDIFSKIGMFEEFYFGYFDEIDLSYRLKKLNNSRMSVTSKAIAFHNHHWTKKKKRNYYFEYYLSERNKFLYFYKYGMYLSIVRSVIIDLLKFPWRLVWFVKVCNFTLGIYYLRGMIAGLFNKKGKPKFVK